VLRTGVLASCGIEAILNAWLEYDHHDKDVVHDEEYGYHSLLTICPSSRWSRGRSVHNRNKCMYAKRRSFQYHTIISLLRSEHRQCKYAYGLDETCFISRDNALFLSVLAKQGIFGSQIGRFGTTARFYRFCSINFRGFVRAFLNCSTKLNTSNSKNRIW
jgi:hypothetical protein